jgi:hypothetical protein
MILAETSIIVGIGSQKEWSRKQGARSRKREVGKGIKTAKSEAEREEPEVFAPCIL